jgi:hypothetical protein
MKNRGEVKAAPLSIESMRFCTGFGCFRSKLPTRATSFLVLRPTCSPRVKQHTFHRTHLGVGDNDDHARGKPVQKLHFRPLHDA